MNYSIIYEMSNEHMPLFPLYFGIAIGVALIAISLCLLKFIRHPSTFIRKVRFYSVGVGIGVFVIVAILYEMKENRDELVDYVGAGHTHVVEGPVENFHPMPPSGHDYERFTVHGESFAYSDYVVTGGFNNAASHGGPIRSGLPVRVTYIDGATGNVIVKLEVSR